MVHKNRFVVEYNMLRKTLLQEHIERNLEQLQQEIERLINLQHTYYPHDIIPPLTRRQKRIVNQIFGP